MDTLSEQPPTRCRRCGAPLRHGGVCSGVLAQGCLNRAIDALLARVAALEAASAAEGEE